MPLLERQNGSKFVQGPEGWNGAFPPDEFPIERELGPTLYVIPDQRNESVVDLLSRQAIVHERIGCIHFSSPVAGAGIATYMYFNKSFDLRKSSHVHGGFLSRLLTFVFLT
ncbi:MAG: hypothetical protein NT031_12710 [Planctomycetota bacterium]|nr:hypothetical protein [Planctomycetota bacterium]